LQISKFMGAATAMWASTFVRLRPDASRRRRTGKGREKPRSPKRYAVLLPYDLAKTCSFRLKLLKSLARPTGIEPVFPP